jgi:serine protease Do
MEEEKIEEINIEEKKVKTTYSNKILSHKNFLAIFFTSVSSLFIFLLIVTGILWHYRARVFGYFAKQYLQEEQNQNINGKNGTAPAFSQDSYVIGAVKKTNPAVVSVIISEEVPKYEESITPDQGQDPFGGLFPGLNLDIPQYKQNGTQKEDVGGGSGFFVSSDGLIVTNKHVVDQKNAEYSVFTSDGKKHEAKVVAKDPVLDIALIKIDGSGYPYLSFGDSDSLQVGQTVIAIGDALGEYNNTVSVGVVSGLSRSITAGDESGNSEVLDHVVQTDAAINPGNSGGPLLDLNGEVIGVNVAVAEGSQSIGFALPINSVVGAIKSVEATGKIIRPYLGVRYIPIDAELKDTKKLSVDYGVLVEAGATTAEVAVLPGSPAAKAGIVENDIILEVDGVKLDDQNGLASLIREKTIGQTINLKIIHKGVTKNVEVTLEKAPDSTT